MDVKFVFSIIDTTKHDYIDLYGLVTYPTHSLLPSIVSKIDNFLTFSDDRAKYLGGWHLSQTSKVKKYEVFPKVGNSNTSYSYFLDAT